jgi:hypothetical protein
VYVAVLMVLLNALSGCGIGSVQVTPPAPEPVPIPRLVAAPTDCTVTPTGTEDIRHALRNATPGQHICLVGRLSPDTELTVDVSGTSSQPIVIESDGATVTGVSIDADNVTVQGFRVWGPGGVSAQGQNLVIRNNDVRDAGSDGILCAPCSGAQIDANWVVHADGVGIVLSGQHSWVRDNDVSRSVRVNSPDADGIGFAGSELTIRHNYVHDIAGEGYPAGPAPHADCFRTADSPGQAATGVLLADNTCANVAGNCLSADGSQRQGATAAQGLRFLHNFCQNGAPQAVSLLAYPDVTIQGNTFSADYRAAVLARQGSSGLQVIGNTLVGTFAAYLTDSSSASGLGCSGNVTAP